MEQTVISGATEAAIRQQLVAYLQANEAAFQHRLCLQQEDQFVLVEIDIDPGGDFESGYSTTRFSAPVGGPPTFAFTIHREGFLADLGKLFGLQDDVIGYPGFDEKMIIKTNDTDKVHALFADETIRKTLVELKDFNLHLQRGDGEEPRLLVLDIEEGITEADALLQLYAAFYQVLTGVNKLV